MTSVIKGKQFDYPVYFDIEEKSQLSKGKDFCSSLIKAFCDEMESGGYYAGFYTSASHAASVVSEEVRKRYAAWIAQWASKCTYSGQYGIWQYSSEGSVNGISGRVDMDMSYVDYPSVITGGGYNGYGKTETSAKKTVDELAKEVIVGNWGNWSINTSCFTSKIKCGICGKSYRRSGKRQRKNPDEVYYVWICRTKSDKGAKFCSAKIIPEKTLKRVCSEVLGTEDFDENAFSERIEKIEVIGDDRLDFYFKDGSVVQKHWESRARTAWWTKERREACSKSRMGKNPRKNDHNPFTGYLHCPVCGANFRRQTQKYKDGTMRIYWHCPNSARCGNKAKPNEDFIKTLIAEATDTSGFDEEIFHQKVERIDLTGNFEATLYRKDGKSMTKTWEKAPKKSYPHTEEYKRHMSELSKERWADEDFHNRMCEKISMARRATNGKESNDNPGNNQ